MFSSLPFSCCQSKTDFSPSLPLSPYYTYLPTALAKLIHFLKRTFSFSFYLAFALKLIQSLTQTTFLPPSSPLSNYKLLKRNLTPSFKLSLPAPHMNRQNGFYPSYKLFRSLPHTNSFPISLIQTLFLSPCFHFKINSITYSNTKPISFFPTITPSKLHLILTQR